MIHTSTGDEPLDVAAFRKRIRKMSDEQLLYNGKAAAYMASPQAAYEPVRETWIQQFAELRAEWRRRHSKAS